VVKQDEAVGHCVRATFLYIPLTDLATLTGRREYQEAADKIWEDAVRHKIYLTGGIGSIRFHEQFGSAYELPNLSAWNETCASYGNIVWNQRMFQLHQDAKYIDVLERVLYNGFADGVSLKGDRFFYQNPLRSLATTNASNGLTFPAALECSAPYGFLGSYIYAQSSDSVYVNLFVGSKQMSLPVGTRLPFNRRLDIRGKERSASASILREPKHSACWCASSWARNEVFPGDLYEYADKFERNRRST
jgi:DUF1680 family protein